MASRRLAAILLLLPGLLGPRDEPIIYVMPNFEFKDRRVEKKR